MNYASMKIQNLFLILSVHIICKPPSQCSNWEHQLLLSSSSVAGVAVLKYDFLLRLLVSREPVTPTDKRLVGKVRGMTLIILKGEILKNVHKGL